MIRYCVWDVGQVIYHFSLNPLQKLLGEKAKSFDYNPYMKGEVDFALFCRGLCDWCGVACSLEQINQALHEGVGDFFQPTRELMQKLPEMGITNCILSNALPCIQDTGNAAGLVRPDHVFCSFDARLLKPDPAIYEWVRASLNCQFSEMIFVDDKSENVDAAAQLGIHAILFDEKNVQEQVLAKIKSM